MRLGTQVISVSGNHEELYERAHANLSPALVEADILTAMMPELDLSKRLNDENDWL